MSALILQAFKNGKIISKGNRPKDSKITSHIFNEFEYHLHIQVGFVLLTLKITKECKLKGDWSTHFHVKRPAKVIGIDGSTNI